MSALYQKKKVKVFLSLLLKTQIAFNLMKPRFQPDLYIPRGKLGGLSIFASLHFAYGYHGQHDKEEFYFNKAAQEQDSNNPRFCSSHLLAVSQVTFMLIMCQVHPLDVIPKVSACCANLLKFSFYISQVIEAQHWIRKNSCNHIIMKWFGLEKTFKLLSLIQAFKFAWLDPAT